MDEQEIIKQVLFNNNEREKSILAKVACFNAHGRRINKKIEPIKNDHDIRPLFSQDTDRIIHSTCFTRYIDKTQVFFLVENDHITHRVLHVQLVSKIARVIGRCLKLNEDLIEAIALGHDIGHVPYGHDGEVYIQNIIKPLGYTFCHNAQSVRFLMELEQRDGLNLTLQVLDGILCHNGEFINDTYKPEYQKTRFHFKEEYEKCWTEPKYDRKLVPMTLEGCVVRVSDIISYIGRDFEDAITLKLISKEDIPKDCLRVLGNDNNEIIKTLVMDVIKNGYNQSYIMFSEEIRDALKKLLKFNNERIYANPKKTSQNNKIENMFKYLFDYYFNNLERNIRTSLDEFFLNGMDDCYRNETPSWRIVVDFIAGMTDDFFNNEFKRLVIPSSFGLSLN